MNRNYSIRCDVDKCRHNTDGCNCSLDSIKVCCGCGDNCTCCGDYQEKE